jgi:hypothetical protein
MKPYIYRSPKDENDHYYNPTGIVNPSDIVIEKF